MFERTMLTTLSLYLAGWLLFTPVLSAYALPQVSVLLPQFTTLPSGINPSSVTAIANGTAFAIPIGTSTDPTNTNNVETTFVIEEIFTTVGLALISSGSSRATITSTAVLTALETVVVSASGWAQSNFPTTTVVGDTILGGGIDCFYTASGSGECVEVEVLPGGVTSSRTVEGDAAYTAAFAITSGVVPPSGSGTSSGSASGSASVTAPPTTTPSSGVSSPAASSNAATTTNAAVLAGYRLCIGVAFAGMFVGGWIVL